MTFDRRKFLKLAGLGLGGMLLPGRQARAEDAGPRDTVAMLYDATKCIGCRACQNACKDWNENPPERDTSGLYDSPLELSAATWTVIQAYEEGDTFSYARQGCMHCVEPACVAACPVHALEKFEDGPVLYDPSRCIGCRYCMLACPFNVPRYTWDQSIGVIAKCTFCDDRLEMGRPTACAERCPTDALIFGTRGELLDEAESRLAEDPDKYVDHVYGKHDAGGTSVLHIAAVPLEKLGLPDLGHEPVPELNDQLAVSILPSVFIGGTILLAGLRFFTTRGRRGEEARHDHS